MTVWPRTTTFAAYTPDALKLFDAATQWASGIGPKPPKTSAKIAWVSFHPADNEPSANAATAGFTNAPFFQRSGSTAKFVLA